MCLNLFFRTYFSGMRFFFVYCQSRRRHGFQPTERSQGKKIHQEWNRMKTETSKYTESWFHHIIFPRMLMFTNNYDRWQQQNVKRIFLFVNCPFKSRGMPTIVVCLWRLIYSSFLLMCKQIARKTKIRDSIGRCLNSFWFSHSFLYICASVYVRHISWPRSLTNFLTLVRAHTRHNTEPSIQRE